MNIGILTYHWVSNFGANLQALSTYCYLLKQGHTPIVIDWIPQDLETYYEDYVPKEQNKAHHKFASKYFTNKTKLCRNSSEVAAEIERCHIDKVIIGSDAVFTYIPKLCRIHLSRKTLFGISKICIDSDFPNPFWGDFLQYLKHPVKICAMSASAQNTNYKKIIEKRHFNKSLSSFSYISVRDIWTKKMISYLTNDRISPDITPDPVFSFEQNVNPDIKREIILKKFGLPIKYALVSITDPGISPDYIRTLSDAFEKEGIELISLEQTNKKLVVRQNKNLSFPIDPMEWYSIIKYSYGYIGELMHPILVSLHNNVPVFAIDLYGFKKGNTLDIQSSKTYQILSRFGFENNYYNQKLNKHLPAASDIVECIVKFDKEKCRKAADDFQQQYEVMMQKILNV